jgi:hypothetical protein
MSDLSPSNPNGIARRERPFANDNTRDLPNPLEQLCLHRSKTVLRWKKGLTSWSAGLIVYEQVFDVLGCLVWGVGRIVGGEPAW